MSRPTNPRKFAILSFLESGGEYMTERLLTHHKQSIRIFSGASQVISCRVVSSFFCLLSSVFCYSYPASAHQVEIAEDVGGTIHIEPNDTPRAGENALTWIALTRKGGKVIPLEQCNCQLAVYSNPQKPGVPPLLTPSLKPVSAEKYQGIPGADINFPKPGAYVVQITGKPQAGADFKPFELKFDVTVAAGVAKPTPAKPAKQVQASPTVEQSNNQYLIPGILVAGVAGLGGVWVALRRKKQP